MMACGPKLNATNDNFDEDQITHTPDENQQPIDNNTHDIQNPTINYTIDETQPDDTNETNEVNETSETNNNNDDEENHESNTLDTPEHICEFGEWQSTETATCMTQGEETRYCTCGNFETRQIPKNPENHVYVNEIVAPTCTEAGYTKHTCACGVSYNDNYVDTIDHEYDENYECIHCHTINLIRRLAGTYWLYQTDSKKTWALYFRTPEEVNEADNNHTYYTYIVIQENDTLKRNGDKGFKGTYEVDFENNIIYFTDNYCAGGNLGWEPEFNLSYIKINDKQFTLQGDFLTPNPNCTLIFIGYEL